MRPKKHETTGSGDLFRARLEQIINMKHELVLLAGKIEWQWIDSEIAPLYSDKGRPGIETRFVIGLLLLKHIYGLSDEGVCERWVHDPYFQHFTGEEFFQHEFPHERSDLSHWRKRLGNKLELLLAESLRVAHQSGALRTRDLKRVTVDTTVQPKAITFPTDAKLLHAAIKGLNRMANKHGVRLRQSYLRIAKRAAMMAGRYAHAKQFNRHRRELRMLRTRLGRIIRDIRRRIVGKAELEAVFAWPLSCASQIRSQQQRQRGWKLYSFHAPEVECIGKGKASAPYEFGVKASIVSTNARAPGGQFVLHAKALPGNPYDGHTLAAVIEGTEKLTGCEVERAYVDKGYRGHETANPRRVFISGQKRGVFGAINSLLKQGATPVTEAADVIDVLRPILGQPPDLPAPSSEPTGLADRADGDVAAARIVALLGPTPVTIDDLIRLSGAAPAVVGTVLLELEIAGKLRREFGGLVALV
jgi:IS5 family transposase